MDDWLDCRQGNGNLGNEHLLDCKPHRYFSSNQSEHSPEKKNQLMTEIQGSKNQALPPHMQLVRMAMAHWQSHIVYAAAKLNIADHLSNGPQDAETLAVT